jgi:hypothetical protein
MTTQTVSVQVPEALAILAQRGHPIPTETELQVGDDSI